MAARLPQATFAHWHRGGRWKDGGGGGGGGGAGGGAGSYLCEAKQLGAIKPSLAAGSVQYEDGAVSNMARSTLPFISLMKTL